MAARTGTTTIIGKELRRFFMDRRILVTTVFIPGLAIYLVYSLMGNALQKAAAPDDSYQPVIHVINLPDSFAAVCSLSGSELQPVDLREMGSVKEMVVDKRADLLIVFPEDFDTRVALQTAGGQGVDVPRVEVFYNSSKSTSIRQFQVIMALLEHYRMSVAPLFFVNSGVDFTMENNVSEPDPTTDAQTYDLATKQDSTGSLFAALLPMLLLIMLFSGCAAVAPESIAGEKERGTMATLLATPMARWELALGKTISLACTALLSGLSSFTGAMLSLPKTMGYSAEVSTLYGGFDYLKLLVVILSTVMLFVCIISLFSALAKTVKEAATYVAPLMIVVTVIGATGMFSTSNADSVVYYLIPVYNSIQCMTGFFLFSSSLLFVAVTVAVNMGASALCIAVLTWMFGNERIVFNR